VYRDKRARGHRVIKKANTASFPRPGVPAGRLLESRRRISIAKVESHSLASSENAESKTHKLGPKYLFLRARSDTRALTIENNRVRDGANNQSDYEILFYC
jgi:hypothetical protein